MPSPFLERIRQAAERGEGFSRQPSTVAPEARPATQATTPPQIVETQARTLSDPEQTRYNELSERVHNIQAYGRDMTHADRVLIRTLESQMASIGRSVATSPDGIRPGPDHFMQPLSLPTGEVIFEASKEDF